MRILLYILSGLISFALSCTGNSSVEANNPKNDNLDSVKADSLELLKKNKIDENKVIGNINFGISKSEYKKQEASFLKETTYKRWVDSDIDGNKIGDFEFYNIQPFFYQNKLYQIVVDGNSIHYEKYDTDMYEQASALKMMLEGKYGEPVENFGIPEWHETQKGYTYLAYGWQIGLKKIEMRVSNTGLFYQLQLCIFQPSVVKILEDEKAKQKVINAEISKDVL